MLNRGIVLLGTCASLLCYCEPALGQTRAPVYQTVTSDKLDTILKDLGVTYQKEAGKKENIFIYCFERRGHKIRLYNYGGADLWIEANFTEKATLAVVNRWNMRAKFSRAVLVKKGTRPTISLEGQIDCSLGITDGMVRQFVERFDVEIGSFNSFLKK